MWDLADHPLVRHRTEIGTAREVAASWTAAVPARGFGLRLVLFIYRALRELKATARHVLRAGSDYGWIAAYLVLRDV